MPSLPKILGAGLSQQKGKSHSLADQIESLVRVGHLESLPEVRVPGNERELRRRWLQAQRVKQPQESHYTIQVIGTQERRLRKDKMTPFGWGQTMCRQYPKWKRGEGEDTGIRRARGRGVDSGLLDGMYMPSVTNWTGNKSQR